METEPFIILKNYRNQKNNQNVRTVIDNAKKTIKKQQRNTATSGQLIQGYFQLKQFSGISNSIRPQVNENNTLDQYMESQHFQIYQEDDFSPRRREGLEIPHNRSNVSLLDFNE